MTPRLRQALKAYSGDRACGPYSRVVTELLAAYEAEPSLPESDKPATTPELRFRVGDRVRATDPYNAGELGTVVGWRVRWDCDCKVTSALGDIEPAPPNTEPTPNTRLDRIEERLKKLEER